MPKTLIVFTYAPAGLGHLRVADALRLSLPKNLTYAIFAPTNQAIESIHRITSVNLIARHITEWIQRGTPQKIFTHYYRNYLKSHTNGLFKQFVNLIKLQPKTPERIVIVSTHFGLAHQLGSIKFALEKFLRTKIYLVVQVTDDSPQSIWYVDTADLIVCPGKQTKNELLFYGRKVRLRPVKIAVIPYPVNPEFAAKLSQSKIRNRLDQYNPDGMKPIHLVIPISGAAVGMHFFSHLIEKLHAKSQRFVFHVVCRQAIFTLAFLKTIRHKEYVRLYTAKTYPQTVKLYNQVYTREVISAEITKPSEQAFKVLLNNQAVAGSFLFFAQPVGRQEYDNLKFLQRHKFLSENSQHTRGWLLPKGSSASAEFIWQQYNGGELLATFQKFQPVKTSAETGDNGVQLFWSMIEKMFV